jgi:predicted transposase/invertase (TIGR01784 family)
MNETKNDTAVPVPFEEATGPIDVTLKNDMMFHLVMARSKKALKGLVCALKGLNSDDVKDVELMNPIDYSMYATKEIILDVKVSLNNNEVIDIELQMYKDRPWEERSLLYLCRSFDSIGEGEDYAKLMPTTFIAIMNDPLFPKYPEFYSKYMLLNIKNFQPYSSKIKLNVLYLNMTEKAEQEDIDNKLVY